MPLLSLIICTYNNADSLKRTIEQLIPQLIVGKVELILINNNSSDHTDEVVKNMISEGASIQYHIQPLQGLSRARNLGVEKSAGEYILFTDDDAEIEPDWVSKYLQKIDQYKADCIFGRILVIWDKPQPWWYDNRYQGFFAVIDHGDEPFPVSDHRYPFFGKNFCVKKSIIHELGGFDPKLGRQGDVLLGGEETAVFDYLIKEKKLIWYFPDLDVGHRLKDREYTEANIRKQHIACAKPMIWFSKNDNQLLFGRSKNLLKNNLVFVIERFFSYIKAALRRDKKEMFYLSLELRRSCLVIWYWLIKI